MPTRRHAVTLAATSVTTVLATGALLAFAGPAHAVTCPAKNACYWTAANYKGSVEFNPRYEKQGHCDTLTFRNQASAIHNRTGRTIRYHDHDGCTGTSWTIYNGESWPNLATAVTLGAPNDRFNSVYIPGP